MLFERKKTRREDGFQPIGSKEWFLIKSTASAPPDG
jgi:hypothetical protein